MLQIICRSFLALALVTTAGSAFAAQYLRGVYQGYSFAVSVEPQEAATLTWDDGEPGFTAIYNANPVSRPRCFCDVYENGARQIVVERSLDDGEPIRVTYARTYSR